MKKLFFLGILGVTFALTGCTHWYSVHSDPSLRDQCKSIERQELFANDYSTDEEKWQTNQRQMDLRKTYLQLGCNHVGSASNDDAATNNDEIK
jgi:hypothetical protein